MKRIEKKITALQQLLLTTYGVPARNEHTPSPLTALIGTILSQNTNDRNSYKAYMNLREKHPSWEEVAKLPLPVLEKTIRAAGLTKQKALAIKNALSSIQKKQGTLSLEYLNELTDKEALEDLTGMKGVGVKTASCVLLFSLFRNVCPVDTHVHRTLNRTGVVKTSSPEKTFWIIQDFLPAGGAHSFHTNLIRLGREFCRPTNPLCPSCPVRKECSFKNKSKEAGEAKPNEFLLLDSL